VVEQALEVDRPGVLTAFVHLTDLRLLRTLTMETVRGAGPRGLRLEFFNGRATGTRILLERHPPFEDENGSPVPSPHVCVVGWGAIAGDLVALVAAEWRRTRWGREPLPMTIVAPGAGEYARELTSTYPPITEICALDVQDADIHSARFQSGDVLLDSDGKSTVSKVYVAVEPESEALAAALGLHGQPATRGIPVVVALPEEDGIATALRGSSRTFAHNIEPFGVLSAALTPTLLMRGVNELLARANHQTYLTNQRARGVSEDRSIVPWEELPESLKNSNRRFADSIGSALDYVGYAIVPAPLLDADRSTPAFTDDELEELAKREHDRWVADLMRDGWRLTRGEKDPIQKLHPLLVPWASLSEAERDKDRDAVRAIPELLASAGLSVIRPGAN
jgi:hypothetical protein